jgi:DNA invertase Pin-like site-specific DNA recombinase
MASLVGRLLVLLIPIVAVVLQMLGVFAEFERSIIQERVRAGLHGMVSSAVFTRASCPAFLPGLPSKT